MNGRIWTSVYLVVLIWPIPSFLERGPGPVQAALVIAGIACFVLLYLRVVWTALVRPHENPTPWSFALFFVVAAALTAPLGELWVFASSFFVITALATSLTKGPMIAGVVVTVGGGVLALHLLGIPLVERWWIPLQSIVFACAIHGFVALADANRRLCEANAAVERLAVDNERLRFARDMHDILGHSLSVMTLKSQLAGRLVPSDPGRARAEIGEVETLSRQALSDVRDAVAGYRELSLPGEIDGARRAFAAAGVRVEVSAEPVPADVEPVLAWVVREGATNVVRHSRAAHCRIRLGVAGDEAYVELTDDGRGPGPGGGHGLRGLAERVRVAGGRLHSAPAAGGGFRLSAHLPLAERS